MVDQASGQNVRGRLFFVLSLVFCAGLAFYIRGSQASVGAFLGFALIGAVLSGAAARATAILLEASLPLLIWFIFGGAAYPHQGVSTAPLAAMVLATGTFGMRSRAASALLLPLGVLWLAAASNLRLGGIGWYGWATLRVLDKIKWRIAHGAGQARQGGRPKGDRVSLEGAQRRMAQAAAMRPKGWRPSARLALSVPLDDEPHRPAGPS